MSTNDVNLAPGNTGNPIKGATQGADIQAVGGGKVAETPDTGKGMASSGGQRMEELKGKVPELEEREKVEQGGT